MPVHKHIRRRPLRHRLWFSSGECRIQPPPHPREDAGPCSPLWPGPFLAINHRGKASGKSSASSCHWQARERLRLSLCPGAAWPQGWCCRAGALIQHHCMRKHIDWTEHFGERSRSKLRSHRASVLQIAADMSTMFIIVEIMTQYECSLNACANLKLLHREYDDCLVTQFDTYYLIWYILSNPFKHTFRCQITGNSMLLVCLQNNKRKVNIYVHLGADHLGAK